jgi:L-asparagine oxygenase
MRPAGGAAQTDMFSRWRQLASDLGGRATEAARVVVDEGARTIVCAPALSLAFGPCSFTPVDVIDDGDQLSAAPAVEAAGAGPLSGFTFVVPGALELPAGGPLATVGQRPVVTLVETDDATFVAVGSAAMFSDGWLGAADNAVLAVYALTGKVEPDVAARFTQQRPDHREQAMHPDVARVAWNDRGTWSIPPAADLEVLAVEAGRRGQRLLPADVHDALVDFADASNAAGALLVSDVPMGDVPATPPYPGAPVSKDAASEFALLTFARRLGQPVGYAPEHGGALVQDLVPVREDAYAQISTSSRSVLGWHTEAAFHSHRPRYLLLACLRGDRDGLAATTLSSSATVLRVLSLRARAVLHEPRFVFRADESYTGVSAGRTGAPRPILTGDRDRPVFVFDDLCASGIDAAADQALGELHDAVQACHTGVVLALGDVLVVDNFVAVHGRTSYRPRYDGTDRWLQRTFVVSDLAELGADRDGRIVTSRFLP